MSKSPGEMKLPRLIYRGAEAEIYLENWYGELAVRKSRIPKPYRVTELDSAIRRSRTLHETNIMHEARKIGIPVPIIQHINPEASSFVMEYIDGPTLKDELYNDPAKLRQLKCKELGKLVAEMHKRGIVHGDLTISNVLSDGSKLFLIDFGLGNFSTELEDFGVDLLLLNRAMRSTHVKFHSEIFNAFLNGYSTVLGKKRFSETVDKMRQIERRGRYFERT
jgi:TP53 regulating kinase and related kinases